MAWRLAKVLGCWPLLPIGTEITVTGAYEDLDACYVVVKAPVGITVATAESSAVDPSRIRCNLSVPYETTPVQVFANPAQALHCFVHVEQSTFFDSFTWSDI